MKEIPFRWLKRYYVTMEPLAGEGFKKVLRHEKILQFKMGIKWLDVPTVPDERTRTQSLKEIQ